MSLQLSYTEKRRNVATETLRFMVLNGILGSPAVQRAIIVSTVHMKLGRHVKLRRLAHALCTGLTTCFLLSIPAYKQHGEKNCFLAHQTQATEADGYTFLSYFPH